jgi:hypothetical protein
MKIGVYQIERITPITIEEQQTWCDILNVPSLKTGSVQVLGDYMMQTVKKSLFKKMRILASTFYCPVTNRFVDGYYNVDNHTFIVTL